MRNLYILIAFLVSIYQINAATCASSIPVITRTGATVCEGKLTAISINGTGTSTYKWFNNSTNASINVSATSSTFFQVTIFYDDSCSIVDSVFLNVNPNPIVTGIGQAICTGETARISATGATTYNWGTFGSTQFINVTPIADQNYSVTGTDAFGCIGVGLAAVTIKPGITASAIGDTICEGDVAFISIENPPIGFTYNWGSLGQGSSVTASPSVNSYYKVIATGTNGCTVEASAFVFVSARTTVSFTLSNLALCIYDGGMQLNGIPAGGYFQGLGVFNSKFLPDSAGIGTHEIKYFYTNPLGGCTDSSARSVKVLKCASAITEITGISKLVAYPNPFNQDLNVEIVSAKKGKAIANVFTMNGVLVSSKEIELEIGEGNKVHFDLPDLQIGIYHLVVNKDGEAIQVNLMKQ